MEQFISEIEQYAAAVGRTPQWVLRKAVNISWSQWGSWKAGRASPTMVLADRVRAYMRAHPPEQVPPSEKDVA